MMAHQWLYQPRYIAVTSNPKTQWLESHKGVYLTQRCLLCVLTVLRGSRPPCGDSPLHLRYQHRPVALPCQKRERDMSTEHFAHKLSAKSNHMASPNFQKLRRCKPLMLGSKETDTIREQKCLRQWQCGRQGVVGHWGFVRAGGGGALKTREVKENLLGDITFKLRFKRWTEFNKLNKWWKGRVLGRNHLYTETLLSSPASATEVAYTT